MISTLHKDDERDQHASKWSLASRKGGHPFVDYDTAGRRQSPLRSIQAR